MPVLRAFDLSLFSLCRCNTGTESLRAGGSPQEEAIIAPALFWVLLRLQALFQEVTQSLLSL